VYSQHQVILGLLWGAATDASQIITESLLLADVVMAAHPKVPLLVTHWCSVLLEDNIVINNVFNSI